MEQRLAARAAATTHARSQRSRSKSDRCYSIESGPYQVAHLLRGMVHEIGRIPYRDDVAERTQAGAVLVLRLRGGPGSMARWSEWPLPVRFVADMLGITKAQAETVLRYLEGEIIERVAPELDICGRPIVEKQQRADGRWVNKATLWRFTERFRIRLEKLHGFRPRQRRAQRTSKSDIGKSLWRYFLGKYKDSTGLANLYLNQIEINLPMSELRSDTRKLIRVAPPSRPSACVRGFQAGKSDCYGLISPARVAGGLEAVLTRMRRGVAEQTRLALQ